MNRAAIGLLALVLLALPVYSVLISLDSDDIARIGGTGEVEVKCPASQCKINRVSWVMTGTAPYRVDKVNVMWIPAETGGGIKYNVCVMIYNQTQSATRELIASGCETETRSGSVTTIVDVTNVNPKDIYYVEIVIVETTTST